MSDEILAAVIRRSQVTAVAVLAGRRLLDLHRFVEVGPPDLHTGEVVRTFVRDYRVPVVLAERNLGARLQPLIEVRVEVLTLREAKARILGDSRASHVDLCRHLLTYEPLLRRFAGAHAGSVLLATDAWRATPLFAVALGLAAQGRGRDNTLMI